MFESYHKDILQIIADNPGVDPHDIKLGVDAFTILKEIPNYVTIGKNHVWLTEEGRYYLTLEYLPIIPPKIDETIQPATNKYEGTSLFKKVWKIVLNIFKNDYVKFIIIGSIIAILVWFFGFNKIR